MALEMNLVTKQADDPTKFVASQSGAIEKAPTTNEEEQIRALFKEASSRGMDELTTVVEVPKIPIPQKFQKPDGTVDEEKLKTSSERLNEAVEQKQKTVDDLLKEYQEREKNLHDLSQKKKEIENQIASVPASVPMQNTQELEQRLRQDYQRDALDTTVKLADAIVASKLAPIMERFQQEEEQRRLQGLRNNVADLAAQDPRFLDPRLNAMVNQVLDEDPGMMRLKNPHKAAWNEVKERLRLGEANQPPAQPSNAMPTLGRSAPPSVSTLPGPISPQNAAQAAQQVNPYSQEGRQFEERLKEMTKDLWQY